MLKAMKSYWAFTNGVYKLVMLVLVPILLVLVSLCLLEKDAGSGLERFFVLYAVDTISDFFFMGGFYKKSNSSLEFLQSSSKYPRVIKEVTMIDIVRRILVYQIPYVVTLLWSIGNPEAMEWCRTLAGLPWLEILIAQLVVLVARHYVMWNQVYLCTAVGFTILCVILLFTLLFDVIQPVITNVILIVFIIAVAIGMVWYTNKKVRESYYDS